MNERPAWRIVFLGILSLLLFASAINGERPVQRSAITPRDGATLLRDKSCLECHQLNGIGGALGPDLSHVGDRLPRQAIEDLLAHPRSMNPRAVMPNPALLPPERAELARFLAGLTASRVATR